ncbi:MAG: hypothetical protein KGQ37_13035 [Hyphomicrobiales bacterium]|nr:hypothetical protein [Hyphomicrobiales bacterium]
MKTLQLRVLFRGLKKYSGFDQPVSVAMTAPTRQSPLKISDHQGKCNMPRHDLAIVAVSSRQNDKVNRARNCKADPLNAGFAQHT